MGRDGKFILNTLWAKIPFDVYYLTSRSFLKKTQPAKGHSQEMNAARIRQLVGTIASARQKRPSDKLRER